MTTPTPTGRPWFVRFIVDHNPFYLLSAACMLAGCLALTNTLSWSPVGLGRILVLIATLNLYECLLIGLGLFLIARRGVIRDGVMLLVLEALFLVDTAFLNSEVFALDERIGWLVNGGLFALAVAKVYVIFRVLRLPLTGGLLPFVLTQIAVLFAMPGVFKHLAEDRNGDLPAVAMYAAWWVAAMLPIGFKLIVRDVTHAAPDATATGRLIARCLIVLAMVSLVAHLATSVWIYKLPFHAANLTPMLLAAAVFSRHMPANRFMRPSEEWVIRLSLPVAAVLLSVRTPSALLIPLPFTGRELSPLMLAIAGAYVVVVYLHAMRHMLPLLAGGAAAACFALFGPSVVTMTRWADLTWAWAIAAVSRLVPKTTTQWGVVAVVASFVLLAMGGAVSMLKGKTVPQQT